MDKNGKLEEANTHLNIVLKCIFRTNRAIVIKSISILIFQMFVYIFYNILITLWIQKNMLFIHSTSTTPITSTIVAVIWIFIKFGCCISYHKFHSLIRLHITSITDQIEIQYIHHTTLRNFYRVFISIAMLWNHNIGNKTTRSDPPMFCFLPYHALLIFICIFSFHFISNLWNLIRQLWLWKGRSSYVHFTK